MPTIASFDLATLIRILEESEMRYQDPKLERHGQSWRIRPFIIRIDPATGKAARKRTSIILGNLATMSRQDALKAKQGEMLTVNAGRVIVQAQLPFSVIIKKYVEGRIPNLGSATQNKYRCHIGKHIEPDLAELRMCELDKATVQGWLNSKRAGLSWATRADLRSILGAIFEQAREWKLWDGENPAHGVDIGRRSDAREKRILTGEDFSRFLAAIPETCIMDGARARLMTIAAVVSGMRISEVLGLQARDVDALTGQVTIRRRWHRGNVDAPKTEASRAVVEVGAGIAEKLAALAKGDGWLFARADNGELPDDRDLQQHVWRPAAEAAGCYAAGFGFHSWRRMCVTWAQQAGATPLEAMKLARHTSVGMTARYTVIHEERRAQIVDGLVKMAEKERVQ